MQQEIDLLRREKQTAVDAALQKGSADISNRLTSYLGKATKPSGNAAGDIDHRLASAWGTPSSSKRVRSLQIVLIGLFSHPFNRNLQPLDLNQGPAHLLLKQRSRKLQTQMNTWW